MRNIGESHSASAVSIFSENSKGSGILVHVNSNLYLVTARHVLYSNKEGVIKLHSDYITVLCPTTVASDKNTRKYAITLTSENSKFSKDQDIAVVNLGTCNVDDENLKVNVKLNSYVVKTEDTTNNPIIWGEKWFKFIDKIVVGNDVYIFGFPTSLGIENYTDFFDTDKPILRRGIISYINSTKRHVVIDCPVYAGNSGGPVFEVVSKKDGRKVYSLIGIISRYIPYRQEWFNIRDNYKNLEYVNSGYSLIITMDIVLDTINS